MVQIIITVDIGEIERRLSKATPMINDILPKALNKHGTKLRGQIVDTLSREYEVDRRTVSSAFRAKWATEQNMQYVLTVNSERFEYERWVTVEDESVCPICGPRHNKIFSRDIMDRIFPAHPNCRCSVELVPIAPDMVDYGEYAMRDVMKNITDDVIDQISRQMKR